MSSQKTKDTINYLADLHALIYQGNKFYLVEKYKEVARHQHAQPFSELGHKQRLLASLHDEIEQFVMHGMGSPQKNAVIKEIFERLVKEIYKHVLDDLFIVEYPACKLDALTERLNDIETEVADINNDVSLLDTGSY